MLFQEVKDPDYEWETPEGIRIGIVLDPVQDVDGFPTMDFTVVVHPAPGYTFTSFPGRWPHHRHGARIPIGTWGNQSAEAEMKA